MPIIIHNSANEQLNHLTRINAADLLRAFELERSPLRGLLEIISWPATQRLARQVQTFDNLVGSAGLRSAGAWLLGQYIDRFAVSGQANIPRSGPVLLVANHPGLFDTVGLFTAIPRDDLLVIAADRPFLRALPHISRRLITLNEATNDRLRVVRQATRHLRSGGALLTFPAGRIEPDPASMADADATLPEWAENVTAFARLVPALPVVPMIVSGVISQAALDHPFAQLRGPEQRAWLAATTQLLFPWLQPALMQVQIGALLNSDGIKIGPAVVAEAAALINAALPTQRGQP